MGQLIGVIAIIYIFVRLPRAGVRSNDGETASADLHPRHSETGPRSLLRSSPQSSAAMRFANNTDFPRCKPRPPSP